MGKINKRLKIIEAKYCSIPGNKCIDITRQVKMNIRNNEVVMVIDNSVAGDPEPGALKRYSVKYIFDGVEYIKEGEEYTKLVIP